MKANVGTIDRAIRLVAGLVLLGCGLFANLASPWNYVAMGIGALMILTAAFRFCPAYTVIGLDTGAKKD